MTTTRFAPSPTGYIHIGNLRTALFNYMIARKQGGEFILRLDDTDPVRSKQEYADGIKEDLEWLGLHWDRVEKQSEPPVYDRSALKLTDEQRAELKAEREGHWRFKLDQERIEWRDGILGDMSIDAASVSDPVLIRGDGQFLYTLASVCDDVDYGVTDVVRGSDHVTNTATQIQIIQALGGTVPNFAHHSLLTGPQGEARKWRGWDHLNQSSCAHPWTS